MAERPTGYGRGGNKPQRVAGNMTDAMGSVGMQIEETRWEREDWRDAGEAFRWHCTGCGRYGPYDVTPMTAAKAAVNHYFKCKAS